MKFPAGITPEENQKLTATIQKLVPYLNMEKVFFVGGLVARYHIENAGKKYPKERPINERDILLTSKDAIDPKATKEFKIHHLHKTDHGMYLVLIDPKTAIKIDLFDNGRPIHESVTAQFAGKGVPEPIQMRSAEDQYVEYVRDCYRVVIIEKIKNKAHYYEDMKMLREIVSEGKAQTLYEMKDNDNYPSAPVWRDKKFGEFPQKLEDAYEESLKFAQDHPERIITTTYSQNKGPVECPECVKNDPDFPLTPQEEIFEIMGWDKETTS
jgi:hypothetical protein